jgi:DNA-binding NtrC family response regulator
MGHHVLAVAADGELREAVQPLCAGSPLREVADWPRLPLEVGACDLVVGAADAEAYEAIRVVRDRGLTPPFLLVAGVDEPGLQACTQLGAVDVIRRPLDPAEVTGRARRLVTRPLVTASPRMQRLLETIARVAPTDLDVLVVGETGTGKERVAQALHRLGARSAGPFVAVDCGAIPGPLLESELFGHERGAFTGADARRRGLLETASGGTFFMDEIGELPPHLQAKLLRVLQERRVRRVGARTEAPIDVRVVAATSRELDQEVAAGRFRQDLLFRINAVQLSLPALRERGPDIAALAQEFVEQFRGESPVTGFTPEALEALARYPWPGNIRELQNIVRRAIALARAPRLGLDDLPPAVRGARRPDAASRRFFDLRAREVEAFEREYLTRTLCAARGDGKTAATLARLPRATFYRLLKRHRLRPKDFRPQRAERA